MSELPLTRIAVSREKQASIRAAVSRAEDLAGIAHVACEEDVRRLAALLADPQISAPIYTLPSQINHDTVAAFVQRHLDERKRGEGLLMVSIDDSDVAGAYYDIQIWPRWGACELSGAIRRDRQSAGQGVARAAAVFDWLFENIGVELICETAALDNVRTARLLEQLGFAYKGEIQSELTDGSLRPSRYWELNKAEWLSQSIRTER